MQVVLCNNETYDELYQKESYKFLHLSRLEQLVGRKGITVLIHEDDTYEEDYWYTLQSQVEALGLFGYCKVQFMDSEGFLERQKPLVKTEELHKQGELL